MKALLDSPLSYACRLADLADFKAVNEIYGKCKCHAFSLLL
jgi:hypothetical protein